MEWSINTAQYLILTEVHDLFIKYFLQTSAKFIKVKLEKFLKILWIFYKGISECDWLIYNNISSMDVKNKSTGDFYF